MSESLRYELGLISVYGSVNIELNSKHPLTTVFLSLGGSETSQVFFFSRVCMSSKTTSLHFGFSSASCTFFWGIYAREISSKGFTSRVKTMIDANFEIEC